MTIFDVLYISAILIILVIALLEPVQVYCGDTLMFICEWVRSFWKPLPSANEYLLLCSKEWRHFFDVTRAIEEKEKRRDLLFHTSNSLTKLCEEGLLEHRVDGQIWGHPLVPRVYVRLTDKGEEKLKSLK